MKKLLLAATVASAVAVAAQANAAQYTISSNITDVGINLAVDAGNYLPHVVGVDDTLAFSGDIDVTVTGGSYSINSGDISLDGVTSLNAEGADVILTFINASGAAANNGVTLNSGELDISAYGAPFQTIELSTNPLNMTDTGVFQGVDYTGLPLGAGVVNPDGSITITLLGLPAVPEGAALAAAVTATNLFTFDAAIFLGGTITLTPVAEIPIPAAAWLFGSALMGLAGVARKRKAATV